MGFFSIIVLASFVIARTSRRASLAAASTGSFLGVVLILNYFVEVPLVIVIISFAALAASMALALIEVARKDALADSS